jgi:hypothetical protein
MQIKLWQLFNSTALAVNRARDMARGGRKDEARDWYRFISNAEITSLLCHYKGPIPIDLGKLKNDLEKLADECHPASHPDNSSDMAAIKANLDTIAFGIFKILERENQP